MSKRFARRVVNSEADSDKTIPYHYEDENCSEDEYYSDEDLDFSPARFKGGSSRNYVPKSVVGKVSHHNSASAVRHEVRSRSPSRRREVRGRSPQRSGSPPDRFEQGQNRVRGFPLGKLVQGSGSHLFMTVSLLFRQ
jgi:hypothetical protein